MTEGPRAAGPALRMLFWESTARCNLRCAHCRRTDQGGAELTTAQGRAMIDSAAAMGRPVIVFSGGEPLLRDDWDVLARYAGERGLRTALASNGTGIDAATAQRLAAAGIARVSVSLDGHEAPLHDRFRGVRGAFDAAMAGIGHLRSAGVAFQVNATVTGENVAQIDRILRLAERSGAVALHLFVLVPVGCGLELAESQQLSAQECEAVLEWACRRQGCGLELRVTCAPQYHRVAGEYLARHRQSPQADAVRASMRGRGCQAGRSVLFVAHGGEVFPCGYFPVSCGNILRQPLERLWSDSPLLADLRDDGRLTGRCGACEHKGVCGGCRARALAADGDIFGEEPLCAYQPSEAPHARGGGAGGA